MSTMTDTLKTKIDDAATKATGTADHVGKAVRSAFAKAADKVKNAGDRAAKKLGA
jgi:hypothetical protein